MNIDYNKNFLYKYNIFNNNNVGIGTFTPKHTLDISGNLNLHGNLNINDEIYLKKKINKEFNILHYNQITNEIKPIELDTTPNNLYKWENLNNQLNFNYLNNIDTIYYNYISSEYNLNQNINIYILSNITITHLFIYKKNNDNQITDEDLGLLNININNNSIIKISKYYYKLNNSIEINDSNKINNLFTININNISSIESSNNCYIKFIGYYNFDKGNTWQNYLYNSNIFVNKNINIGTTNIHNYQLFVNNNVNVNYDLNINNTIISNNICYIKNNLNIKNKIIISSIINTKHNLNINFNNKKLSICTNNNNTFCNIGNNTEIDYNGNVKTYNYNLLKDLYLTETNNYIKYNNNNLINFNQKNTILNSFIFNKNLQSKSTINDINLLITNNLNICTINKSDLYIDGNISVTGNIDVNNNINILQNTFINSLNKYVNNINITNNFNAYNVNTNIIKTNLLILPKYKNYLEKNKPGSIYYNTSTNDFFGFDNNQHIRFLNFNIDNNNIISKYNLNIPIKYNTNINIRNNLGRLQYNSNSLKAEIYNGYKYGSIEYENNITEIENIYVGNLNALKPKFHKRISYYTYDDTLSYINIITNPYTQTTIQQKFNNAIQKETINLNNTSENNMLDYNLDTKFIYNNLHIINNRNNINMFYKINTINKLNNNISTKIQLYNSTYNNFNFVFKNNNLYCLHDINNNSIIPINLSINQNNFIEFKLL